VGAVVSVKNFNTRLAIGLLLLITPFAADAWAKMLGAPVARPLALVPAIGGFALPLVWSHYFVMLAASDGPAGSRDREGYDALRRNLATGGPATHLYARWLTAFLDRVDRSSAMPAWRIGRCFRVRSD
jgi:hypothetical protein